MYSFEPLEAPTYWRTVRFWLASISLGTIYIVFLLSAGEGQLVPDAFHLYVGGIAALASLPALLFLLVSLRWAVGEGSVAQRWGRLFAVQSSSAGFTTALMYYLAQHDDFTFNTDTLLEIGGAYYVAGLVAAYWLYHDWLQNPARQPLEDQSS
jgi:hypothetical protein